MRTFGTITLAAGALALAAAGCAGTEPGPPGSTFNIQVAPLEGGITEACYTLEVFSTDDPASFDDDAVSGNLVWRQEGLCSSSYGVNGQLRYSGVCANTEADADGTLNGVRLTIESLEGTGGSDLLAGGFINPCPAGAVDQDNGCVIPAVCKTNTDTQIEFNLTVMRQAQFGFFDVAVRFNEVFCAAKVDCERDDSTETLQFLQKPDGTDGDTVIVGFACFAGTNTDGSAKPLYLYLDDIIIDCGSDQATVFVGNGPGNLAAADYANTTGSSDVLFGASVSQGASMQGGMYVNTLLGMNTYDGCTLTTKGTASPTALSDSYTTPDNASYPYVDFNVELGDGNGRTCSKHPLFGTGANAGVSAPYTGVDATETFDNEFTVAAEAPAVACPCWDHAALTNTFAAITSGGPGTYSFDHDLNDDELGFQASNSTQTVEAWVEDEECEYYYNSTDGTSSEVESDVSAVQQARCIADLNTVMENRCADPDNGGCEPGLCVYDGPGQSHCIACLQSSDCASGHYCTSNNLCAPGECGTDEQCADTNGHCDLATNTCACSYDTNDDGRRASGCGYANSCSPDTQECVAGCVTNDDCSPWTPATPPGFAPSIPAEGCNSGSGTCEPIPCPCWDQAFITAATITGCTPAGSPRVGVTATLADGQRLDTLNSFPVGGNVMECRIWSAANDVILYAGPDGGMTAQQVQTCTDYIMTACP